MPFFHSCNVVKKDMRVGLDFQLLAEYSVVDRYVFLLEINVNQNRKAELIKQRYFWSEKQNNYRMQVDKNFPMGQKSLGTCCFCKTKTFPRNMSIQFSIEEKKDKLNCLIFLFVIYYFLKK